MPIFVITAPDGKEYEVEAPEGATESQALSYFQQNWKPETKEEKSLKGMMPTPAETGAAMTGGARGIVEAGAQMLAGFLVSPFSGGRGIYGLATGETADEAADAVKRWQSAAYQPRTEEGQRVAEVAAMPMELASKGTGYVGGKVGKALGSEAAGETIGEITPAIAATLYGGRAALQAGRNIQPPTVVPQAIKDVARTRTKGGQVKLAEEYLKKMTTPEEASKVVSALERRSTEMVPGSPVTSADAIARANREMALKGQPERFGGQYVALQEGLASVPETTAGLRTVQLQQEAARAKVLQRGAGTESQYASAKSIRDANANRNYGAIRDLLVRADDEINSLLSRPSMDKAVSKAAQLAAEKNDVFVLGKNAPATIKEIATVDASGVPVIGQKIVPSEFSKYPVQSLQYIKMAMDDMVKDPKTYGLGKTELKLIGDTRAKFIDWIERKAPAYQEANTIYAIDSLPIAQMDLWSAMKDKFISPTGKEAPGSYLRALRDETKLIKEATGFKRGTGIDKIFNKEQSALAARLAAEMEMEIVKKRMASEVNLPGVGKAAQAIEPQLPNMLMRETMVANFILKTLAKNANVDVNIAAANILKDPKALAGVLKQVKVDNRAGVLKALKNAAASKEAAVMGTALMENE